MRLAFAILLLSAACAASPPRGGDGSPQPQRPMPIVSHWGEMRVVLREGRTEGRVDLADVVAESTIAVGALEGLTAEITVVGGVAHLAQVDGDSTSGVRSRPATHGDRAALLVAANVPEWTEHELGSVSDLASLEERIRTLAGASDAAPFPFRVEGTAGRLDLHVLAGSCPIADPDGPSPWRYSGRLEPATLVGFYAQDSIGVLTHHGRATHTHALLARNGISGHLDEVSFPDGARLYLPAR